MLWLGRTDEVISVRLVVAMLPPPRTNEKPHGPMMSQADNPYVPTEVDSSNTAERKRQETLKRQNSMLRGFACSLLAAGVGFCVPYVLALIFWLLGVYPTMQFPPTLEDLLGQFLLPALGVMFLFALAALLNYSPGIQIGMVRALVFVGFSIIGSIFLVVFVEEIVLRRSMPDLLEILIVFLALFAIPCLYTATHTAILFRRSNRKREEALAAQSNRSELTTGEDVAAHALN